MPPLHTLFCPHTATSVPHQLSLSAGLTTSYVLGAPRQSVISTNKEGLVSLSHTGYYLAIHRLSLSTGTLVIPIRYLISANGRPARKQCNSDAPARCVSMSMLALMPSRTLVKVALTRQKQDKCDGGRSLNRSRRPGLAKVARTRQKVLLRSSMNYERAIIKS
ncbi:hypothetical protein EDB85DRAFT_1890141 [Lactarius pseudohatsudake]|nr:hypothetical protein EDB85DRAFT_1890141 [Lactarius pseudohatsudake]